MEDKAEIFEQKHRNGVRYLRMIPYFTVTLTLAIGWLCLVLTSVKAEEFPTLAQIKFAAEKGDARAQSTLGDRYRSISQYSEAVKWYRLAAEKGVADAQYELGAICLRGQSASPGNGVNVPKNPQEAMKWLYAAANQNHGRAQLELGHCFRGGNEVVKQDLVEAYRWYALAAKKNVFLAHSYLDPLILKMSSPEIREGQRRADSFKGDAAPPQNHNGHSSALDQVVVQGIADSKGRKVAVINGRSFATGEEGTIKAGKTSVTIICYDIRDASVVVGIAGTAERKELPLNAKH